MGETRHEITEEVDDWGDRYWAVYHHLPDGLCYGTDFHGPDGERRAREYVDWLKSKGA